MHKLEHSMLMHIALDHDILTITMFITNRANPFQDLREHAASRLLHET